MHMNDIQRPSGSSGQLPVTPIGGNRMHYALWESGADTGF